MRKCVTRCAPSSSGGGVTPPSFCRIVSCRSLRAHAWSSMIRNFFDGARHAEGSDVERYRTWGGRIKRKPRRTGEVRRGCAVFTNPDKEPRQTRRREEIGHRISLFKLSYGETRQRNLLSTLSIPSVSRGCNKTRSLDRRTEPMDVIQSRFLNKNFLYICNIQVCSSIYK